MAANIRTKGVASEILACGYTIGTQIGASDQFLAPINVKSRGHYDYYAKAPRIALSAQAGRYVSFGTSGLVGGVSDNAYRGG